MAEITEFTIAQENQTVHDIITKQDIITQLQNIGIQRGMTIIVDAQSANLGYISGGIQSFIEALMHCVGYEGTIVMPAFTPNLIDPACSSDLQIDREHWKTIRENALAFNRKLTPPETSDVMIHQFLRNDGVVRSYHPLYSFAAWGKYAKIICDKHPLHFGLSKESPLGKLTELNGFVLLVGCGYEVCTVFQLARYSGEQLPIKILSSPIEHNNQVIWKDMLDLQLDKSGFEVIGEVMEERKIVKNMYLNAARCRLFSAREAVNIATAYFHIN